MNRGEGPWSGGAISADRFGEASDWFARMRGPDAIGARADFESWIADSRNARAYAEIEAIWNAAAHARVLPSRRLRLRPGLIAAGIGCALTLGLLAQGYLRPGGLNGSESLAAQTYAASPAADRHVKLADGTTVTLNRNARMEARFAGGERRVALLAGAARFVVAHDATHPFVVTAGGQSIVARGTVFDVEIGASDTRVTLIEGAVDLERRAPGAATRLVGRLKPGETAIYRGDAIVPRIAESLSGAGALDSGTGIVTADDIRLSDLLLAVNRQGLGPRLVAAPELGDLRVSGGYAVNEPEQVAAGLSAAFDLSVTAGEAGTLVLARRAPGMTKPPLPPLALPRSGRVEVKQ